MSDQLKQDQERLTQDRAAQGEKVDSWREVLNPTPPTTKAPGDLTAPGGGAKQTVPTPRKR